MGCTASSKAEEYTPFPKPPSPPEEPVVDSDADDLMRMDKALDEVEIDFCLDDYPVAEPPPSEGIGLSVVWLNVETNANTWGVTKRQPSSLQTTDRPTVSFRDVDKHARSATLNEASSFDSLFAYLRQPISSSDAYREVKMARALVVWLGNQNTVKNKYGEAEVTTPTGLLQYLKTARMTYATCYTLLCRKAGLKCVLIKGIAKAGQYQPGDNNPDVLKCAWTVVHVDGNWQIVHPFWVCRGVFGKSFGGWMKLETDGVTTKEKQKESAGILRNAFQDFYFMPKPSEFIYECFVSETKWQLLPTKKQVRSVSEFFTLPYLLPPFFGLGLKLRSEEKCELTSTKGTCKIEIECTAGNAHKLSMMYELFLEDSQDKTDEMVKRNTLPRLVLHYRKDDRFIFELRCPVEGAYKIVIYGGLLGAPALRLCEFKIHCEKRQPGCKLLPKTSGIGWGPGPASEAAGLHLPTKLCGVIPMKTKTTFNPEDATTTSLKFQLHPTKMLTRQYTADMIGSDSVEDEEKDTDLNKNIKECRTDPVSRQLMVKASIPREGEFALVIKAADVTGKKKDDEKNFKPVCYYLLTSLVQVRESPPQRHAKGLLTKAVDTDSIPEIEKSLEKCRKEKLGSSDDDFFCAETRLEFLKTKRALYECILRRNMAVTVKMLMRVREYEHQELLSGETKKVWRLKSQLEQLGGYTKEIPSLREASHEIVALQAPPAEVFNTIKALFLLTGYDERELYDWYFMQHKMRASPELKPTVFKLMESISEKNIEAGLRTRISTMLGTYTQDQIRSVLDVYEKTDES